LLIFGVAIFDTIYVVILRILKKKSPFLGSKDHYAIRLKFAGWPVKRIVIGSYAAAALLSLLAVINMFLTFSYSLALYIIIALGFLTLGVILARIKVA
jgi:UDP-GlcNAc:undecaprenyl-phosphate GlcNAc-1-phosphate transferase